MIEGDSVVDRYVSTSAESRSICNDPFVTGFEYTSKLQQSSTVALQLLKEGGVDFGEERKAVVFNILRGGLNYGLRAALHDAFDWNNHSSAFISSQRAQDEKGEWYITENRYQKVYLPDDAHIIFGDVVATGVSLEHAILQLVDIAKEQQKNVKSMTFFTIGGSRSEEIMEKVDGACREAFTDFEGLRVIYFEGVFGVAQENSELQIALGGTDLLRSPALMAPEFIESQAEELSYPIERCTIYDAGSRAFHIEEYLEDVTDYWSQVRGLAENGTTLAAYVQERFPESVQVADAEWYAANDTTEALANVATAQIAKAE